MKKLSLLFVLVLAVTLVMAQSNESNVSQMANGATSNYAKVDQDGKMNTSDVMQEATYGSAAVDNKTMVNQDGKGNSVYVDQEFQTWAGSPKNKVVVDQDGEGNAADVKSQAYWGHDIHVKQDGKANAANVTVKRNGNDVEVIQKNGNMHGTANVLVNAMKSKAAVLQDGGKYNMANQKMGEFDVVGGGNDMYIKQVKGNGNTASQYLLNSEHMGGKDNSQKIVQEYGTGNTAVQRAGEWVGRDVITSNYNTAMTTQDGGTGNTALIEQIKNGHYAKQEQIGGSGNYAEIKQTNGWLAPTGAKSVQTQKGAGGNKAIANVFNGDGMSEQYQDGKDNYSRIAQAGSENMIKTKQLGQGNSAFAQTTGGMMNEIKINQDGKGNWAATKVAHGNSNMAVVDQDGNWNKVGENNWSEDGIFQEYGDNNYAKVTQKGDYNESSIHQMGDDNVGTISITGNGHMSAIMQTGAMNQAIVLQSN